jgi:hypothetical protein
VGPRDGRVVRPSAALGGVNEPSLAQLCVRPAGIAAFVLAPCARGRAQKHFPEIRPSERAECCEVHEAIGAVRPEQLARPRQISVVSNPLHTKPADADLVFTPYR